MHHRHAEHLEALRVDVALSLQVQQVGVELRDQLRHSLCAIAAQHYVV